MAFRLEKSFAVQTNIIENSQKLRGPLLNCARSSLKQRPLIMKIDTHFGADIITKSDTKKVDDTNAFRN